MTDKLTPDEMRAALDEVRRIMKLYTPGSAAKVATMLAALDQLRAEHAELQRRLRDDDMCRHDCGICAVVKDGKTCRERAGGGT